MILGSGSDLGKQVELWGFEPQTSCMPCKNADVQYRQMPARDGPCGSIPHRLRLERRSGHDQKILKLLGNHMITRPLNRRILMIGIIQRLSPNVMSQDTALAPNTRPGTGADA